MLHYIPTQTSYNVTVRGKKKPMDGKKIMNKYLTKQDIYLTYKYLKYNGRYNQFLEKCKILNLSQ